MRISPARLLAASVLLLMPACTGAPPAADDQGDPNSIKWLIEEPEDAKALQQLKDHIATFEKDSGIDVEISTLPFENMRTVLQTQLRSGDGPDVFNWGSGPGFGGALAEAGMVHDLTSAYEENDWEVYDFAKEQVTVDGKLYGVPGEMETIGLFYNKDVFDRLGIEAPQSLDALHRACEKINHTGMTPMTVADKDAWEGGHYLSMALSSEIGPDGMESLLEGDSSWDSPDVANALQVWKDLQDKGYTTASPTSVDYDTSISQFYSGQAAMLPTGSWLAGEIDDSVDFEVGYVPFPASDGPGVFAAGLGSGPYISATTAKKDAALEFVDFLASPEHARWTVRNLHTIPPVPVSTKGLDVSPLFAGIVEDVSAFAEGKRFGYNIDVVTADEFNDALYDGVQAVFTGQATPEETAASLEEAASS